MRHEITMEQVHSDCDLLTGKNCDGIKYDSCSECYRYDTCSQGFEKDLQRHKERYNISLCR